MKINWPCLTRSLRRFANAKLANLDVFQRFSSEPLANDQKESWVHVAPYGKFDHSQGMQSFELEDAQECVKAFENSRGGKPGTQEFGLPFYIGHPHTPCFAGKPGHTDTRSYGRILKMEARPDGLFANVAWSKAGQELIAERAYHGHSVNWGAERIKGLWRPREVYDIGFTNTPNLPVRPITNSENMNLIALAQSLGLPETATEAEILAAANAAHAALLAFNAVNAALKIANAKSVDELAGKVTSLTNELATANEKASKAGTDIATIQTSLTNTTSTLQTVTGERDAARTNFANERKTRIDVELQNAITSGRITPPQLAQWKTDLANEGTFVQKMTELANLKPSMKVVSMVGPLGERNAQALANAAEKGRKAMAMVKDRMAAKKMSYDAAWSECKQEAPALFADE